MAIFTRGAIVSDTGEEVLNSIVAKDFMIDHPNAYRFSDTNLAEIYTDGKALVGVPGGISQEEFVQLNCLMAARFAQSANGTAVLFTNDSAQNSHYDSFDTSEQGVLVYDSGIKDIGIVVDGVLRVRLGITCGWFGEANSRPSRPGSWPLTRRCALRSHALVVASGSSNRSCARRPSDVAAPRSRSGRRIVG